MERQLGVRAFAVAYVLAREVAHDIDFVFGVATRAAAINERDGARLE